MQAILQFPMLRVSTFNSPKRRRAIRHIPDAS
jgi:hypothetical protein